MIIIPCKYTNDVGLKYHYFVPNNLHYSGSSSTIIDTINNCKKFMPEEKIIVVDSNSEDKSYYSFLKRNEIEIIEGNVNFEAGALWKAYMKYPNEEYYIILQDTMIPVSDFRKELNEEIDVLAFIYTNDWESNHIGVKDWVDKNYAPDQKDFKSIIFNSFIVKNKVLDHLHAKKFSNILPSKKEETGGMERLWGIIFKNENIKVKYLLGHLFDNSWGTLHNNPYFVKNFGHIYKKDI